MIGWPASTAIVRTAPSVRKKLASNSRAPLPCRSMAAVSTALSEDSVSMMASWVATGSAKRFSTT